MKIGSLLAVVLLGLIAIAHLVRFVVGTEVLAGGMRIPVWISLVAAVVTAGIAAQLWRERH